MKVNFRIEKKNINDKKVMLDLILLTTLKGLGNLFT